MTIANFEELCKGLCEVAGCAPAQMAVNERGAKAISVMLDGVEVTLGHDPQRSATHAYVLVRFGKLPEGRELPACIALLQTNTAMLGADSPSFGYDTLTDEVLLLHPCAFDTATPVGLYQSIVRFVGIAREWRGSHFLAVDRG